MTSDQARMTKDDAEAWAFPGGIERFKNIVADRLRSGAGVLFGCWRRFGSVIESWEPAPSPRPCQNQNILAPIGHSIFLKCSRAASRGGEVEWKVIHS